MRLGFELTIEQTQKLVMTPELIQAIQILQYNTQELDTFVGEQLLTNPVLELAERKEEKNKEAKDESGTDEAGEERKSKDEQLAEYIRERSYDDFSYKQRDYSRDDEDRSYEQYVAADITLQEHLMFQLQFVANKTTCRRIGRYIIESLDENGYMTLTEEEIATELETSIENVEKVLGLIQTFDPVGVGATSLANCLMIQLASKGLLDDDYRCMLREHINDIADNRLAVIGKKLSKSTLEVQAMVDVIKGLEPKPGCSFSSREESRYIVPDVMVEKIEGEYIITINEKNVPHLMVSSYYRKVLAESKNDEKLNAYLTDRLNSALWLIKSIEQRKHTILNVVNTILKFQRDYFEYGDKYLRTLTLRQVADELGIHESTVSRSISGKYMQTSRGIFELKYFFSAGVSDGMGEGISSKSIKTHIREILDEEDRKNPYSDQQMVEILAGRGIELSRRTVAKYRGEMNIPSSSRRKRF